MKSFVVTPMRQELTLEPGGAYEGYITVLNPADAEDEIKYHATISPYMLDAETEAELDARATMGQIVDWMTLDNGDGTLSPNETGKVAYRIEVPADAPAGGQYAMIGISIEPEVGEGAVQISDVMELGSVIFGEVTGETTHDGELLSNNIPGFVTSLPAVTTAKVVNNGNVHEVAEIKLIIKDVLSGEVLFPIDEQHELFNEVIMPASERNITKELTVLSELGVYEVTQDITYMGETTHNTRIMIACPIWFILLVIATIVTAAWTILMIIKRNRNRKRII